MMFDVRLDTFRVGLTEPIHTARGSVFERTGLILAVHDDAGHWGRGEVAPLAGWSSVDLPQATEQLRHAADSIGRHGFDAVAPELAPDVKAAVDSARWSLEAARADRPLWAFLGASSGEIEVNSLLVGERAVDLGRQAQAAMADGVTTLKAKLGMADDGERIQALADVCGPGVRVRLDANAAWSVAEAVDRLDAAAETLGGRLEYVEDPVGSLEDLAALRAETSAPVAVDEVVRSPADLDRVIEERLGEVLVVKPALLGGITPTVTLADQASANGVDVVVSSLYDGPVGLATWCHLAASIPGTRAHGLGTATLLADAGAAHLVARHGRITLR